MPESQSVVARDRVNGGMDYIKYKKILEGERYVCCIDCDDGLTAVVYILFK